MRAGVIQAIHEVFGFEVAGPDDQGRRGRRQDAFLLCRRALLVQGSGSYAEQFEGLYSLMRGLTAAALLGAAFLFGWTAGWGIHTWNSSWGEAMVAYLVLATTVAWTAGFANTRPAAYWFLCVASVPVGAYLGHSTPGTPSFELLLLLFSIVGFLVFAAHHFREGYEYFTLLFAATVYRDFYVLHRGIQASP